MKIDTAINDFMESVSREALASIDDLSKERGLVLTRATFDAFTLKESCDKFAEYLKGYAKYKVDNIGNPKASTQEAIQESTDRFISSDQLFQETTIKYSELPGFVQAYVEGIQNILESVNSAKTAMQDADVDAEAIGAVNEFTDAFIDRLNEHFKPWMEKVLLASGHTTNQRLFSRKINVEPTPIFL